MPSPSDKTDLLQGTLNLLILQVTALGPVHGYAIAQRLNQITLVGAALVLGTVGGASGWLPAYRASRIDPAEVLRDS